ncbi:MAG: hypothetical protein KatS3mg089_0223 [Patescibacteria group bacterium]|nr:MAG: hypothetical protein KatS3mg089_0223 [Patescibacteria group bacterium]
MIRFYKKEKRHNIRKFIRILSLLVCCLGVVIVAYVSFPFISFQLYLHPVFAQQGVVTPIPKTTVISESSIKNFIRSTTDAVTGVDYTNARNWYPSFNAGKTSSSVTQYYLSIPKLSIQKAIVSVVDNDLSQHLVHYGGTSVPPNKGNAVIFGHSTLPQLYNPKDYKTIFANLHTLTVGDLVELTIDGVNYTYRIYKITITDPNDTSFFSQNYDDNYLTLVTCTPPGTTWMRLIVQARII